MKINFAELVQSLFSLYNQVFFFKFPTTLDLFMSISEVISSKKDLHDLGLKATKKICETLHLEFSEGNLDDRCINANADKLTVREHYNIMNICVNNSFGGNFC